MQQKPNILQGLQNVSVVRRALSVKYLFLIV